MHRFLPLALALSLPLPAFAQENLQWFYNRYVAENPLETHLSLVYGIPESDGIQASAVCSIGANWVYAALTMGSDVEGIATDATVTVDVSGPSFNASYQASVIRYEEFIHGVEFAVPLDDPFWTAIATQPWMRYGVRGRTPNEMPLAGAAAPAQAFLADCRNIGDLPPDAPDPRPMK